MATEVTQTAFRIVIIYSTCSPPFPYLTGRELWEMRVLALDPPSRGSFDTYRYRTPFFSIPNYPQLTSSPITRNLTPFPYNP